MVFLVILNIYWFYSEKVNSKRVNIKIVQKKGASPNFLYKSAQAELKTHQKKALFEPILFRDIFLGNYQPLYYDGKT